MLGVAPSVHGEAGVAPGKQELGALVAQQTLVLQQVDDLVAEVEPCRVYKGTRRPAPVNFLSF